MTNKLKIKKEFEKEIDECSYNEKKVSVLTSKGQGLTYKHYGEDYWNRKCLIANTKLFQLKEDVKEELKFLEKLHKIVNTYKSDIPMVGVGRQNVLNDIDNELNLDKRIIDLKKVLGKNGK